MEQAVSNLNKIIELSSSMLETARKDDWEQVLVLERQRKTIFDQTFPLDTNIIKDVTGLAKQVQQVSDLDKEILSLAAKSREGLSRLVRDISTGRQAVNAYRNVAGR